MRRAPLPEVTALKDVPLFVGLAPDELLRLHESMQYALFSPNDTIMQQGGRSAAIFIAHTGAVKISRTIRGSNRQIVLNIVGPGAPLGILHLLDGDGHSASVTALENTACFMMLSERFLEFVRDYPLLGLAVSRYLAAQIRFSAVRQEILSLHYVAGAVAAQLLLLASEQGQPQENNSILIPFSVTQCMISDLTGHSRESVNKCFQRFLESGWVECQPRRRIVVRDSEALRRLWQSAQN